MNLLPEKRKFVETNLQILLANDQWNYKMALHTNDVIAQDRMVNTNFITFPQMKKYLTYLGMDIFDESSFEYPAA